MSLSELLGRAVRPPTLAGPPQADALSAAARLVRERWPDLVVSPQDADRDRLLVEIAERLRRGDWEGCKVSRIQQAIIAAFDPERVLRPEFRELRAFLLAECRETSRPALLRAAMGALLEGWSPKAPQTRALSEVLRARRMDLSRQAKELLDSAPEVLETEGGHKTMAARLVAAETPFAQARQLGFQAPHGPGFMKAAHGEFLRLIAPELETGDTAGPARLLAWIAPPKEPPREDAAAAISALLRPWRSREAPEELRRLISNTLISAYGDPRVGSRSIWGILPDADHAVMLRWLVGATLEAFLDVVAQSVRGVEGGHMNHAREVFWREMFRRGAVEEAWVALNDTGREIAATRARRLGDPSLNAHGRQIGRSNGDSDRSLIIMRCRGKIVIEGSHNFRIHIFDKNVARDWLYQEIYDANDVRRASDAERKSHLGDWQAWVRERIL